MIKRKNHKGPKNRRLISTIGANGKKSMKNQTKIMITKAPEDPSPINQTRGT